MHDVHAEAFDLNLLLVFDALWTERNVTRAARRVGLTQPATSHALRRLREQLDDPLFLPTPGGLQPTSRALALAPALSEALALVPVEDPAQDKHVVHELQAGYRLGERVLRPARVAVGRLVA